MSCKRPSVQHWQDAAVATWLLLLVWVHGQPRIRLPIYVACIKSSIKMLVPCYIFLAPTYFIFHEGLLDSSTVFIFLFKKVDLESCKNKDKTQNWHRRRQLKAHTLFLIVTIGQMVYYPTLSLKKPFNHTMWEVPSSWASHGSNFLKIIWET